MRPAIPVDKIKLVAAHVAELYGISVKDLLEGDKPRKTAASARHLFRWLLVRMWGCSRPEAGALLQCDQSSITNSVHAVDRERKRSADYTSWVDAQRAQLASLVTTRVIGHDAHPVAVATVAPVIHLIRESA